MLSIPLAPYSCLSLAYSSSRLITRPSSGSFGHHSYLRNDPRPLFRERGYLRGHEAIRAPRGASLYPGFNSPLCYYHNPDSRVLFSNQPKARGSGVVVRYPPGCMGPYYFFHPFRGALRSPYRFKRLVAGHTLFDYFCRRLRLYAPVSKNQPHNIYFRRRPYRRRFFTVILLRRMII